MVTSNLLIAGLASLLAIPQVDAAVGSYCSKKPYNCILSYSNYGPAKSDCAANYPAPTKTAQTKAQHTVTVTSTTYVLEGGGINKRAKTPPGWEPCSSALSEKSDLSKACQCIQTASTVTHTKFEKKTATTTTVVTVYVPQSTSAPFTPPPAHHSSTTVSPACPAQTQAQDGNYDYFNYHCGQRIVNANLSSSETSQQVSLQGCLNGCDAFAPYCCGGNYHWETFRCYYLFKTDDQSKCLDPQNAPSDSYVQNSDWDSFDMYKYGP